MAKMRGVLVGVVVMGLAAVGIGAAVLKANRGSTMTRSLNGESLQEQAPTGTASVSSGKSQVGGNEVGSRKAVVLELFTSEGCSSCPPADTLLARLQAEQPVQGAEVIALEEHVDYWDSQGWVDPFSSTKWTARQDEYVTALRLRGSYTPQLVVNGRTELVGNAQGKVVHEIDAAAKQESASGSSTDVAVTPGDVQADRSRKFTVCVGKIGGGTNGDKAEVVLAVTETGLRSHPTRGENSGADLAHAAVVRRMEKIGVADAAKDLSFTADPVVKVDSSWKKENLRVVVFVQEKKSKKILGAAEAKYEEKK